MIAKISGQLVAKNENSLIINVGGISYEVWVPQSVMERVTEGAGANAQVELITYHYLQISPSSGIPVLVGFLNDIERDFFLQFIKVSGIGPRAAVKALNKPISEIAQAITAGDTKYLQSLPGIGLQRAKEIVAKLQNKVGIYGLIQDKPLIPTKKKETPDWQNEALAVLLQLQYKKSEAEEMIRKALDRKEDIQSAEELLNEIYKQKVHNV